MLSQNFTLLTPLFGLKLVVYMKFLQFIMFFPLVLSGLFLSSTASAQTSESLREQNPFYFAVQGSIWSGPNSAYGAKIGWRSARVALEGQYNNNGHYSTSSFSFWPESERTNFKNEAYSVDLKYFVGNSFYAGGGLSYQIRRSNHVSQGPHFIEVEDGRGYSEILSEQFFIGNQWEFSHMTLGVDWVGVSLPVAYINESNYGPHKPDESFMKKAGFEVYLSRLYAGVAF
jgi:hypothetical protein